MNINLKSKFILKETIYDYLKKFKYKNNKNIQNEIKENLKRCCFKISYDKRKYKIDDILFERTPMNTTINFKGEIINFVKYYSLVYNLSIKDKNQPLILVRKKDRKKMPINLFFVPEFCSLPLLKGDITKKDRFLFKEIGKYSKLEPTERVNKTNEILNLLFEKEKDKDNLDKMNFKEKYKLYGIEIEKFNNFFDAYYMKKTKLYGGNNQEINSNDRVFPIFKKKDMTNWACFYEKNDYNDAKNLYDGLIKASNKFGIKIAEPKWIEMESNSSAKDWTDLADDYFGNNKSDYDFAIFLLGKKYNIYTQLKKNSLCKNGYVSQVVRVKTIQKKNALSVYSNLLLQINTKLGGISYKIEDNSINERKLMVVGVNSSYIKGKGIGVGMVSTINDSFTNFFNKETIIKEEDYKEQGQYYIKNVIELAFEAYKNENKELPRAIIIYRQGISLKQKEYLKSEITQIDLFCKIKNILYYYIIVNTKTNFKFFEKYNNKFTNPGSGLLVIDGVTNKNFFEFYIQPHEVTQGSAIPTCFLVAYGNLNSPEFVPKFTYDLCHLYNYSRAISVPNVIKAAEKLTKMTIKFINSELNKNFEKGQAYI